MQAAATSQIDSDDDLEFEKSSDKETQVPAHEWQSVGQTKKRKRSQSQKPYEQTKQIHTSNRFQALSQQNSDSSKEQTQPSVQLIPKPTPIFIYGVLNYKKMNENVANVTEEERYQC